MKTQAHKLPQQAQERSPTTLSSRLAFTSLLAAGLVAFWLLSAARKRIGGVTGDVFGALIETTECAVLAACCLP